MKKFNTKSISVKFSLVMLGIITIQALLLTVSILASGVIDALKENAHDLFSKNAETNSEYVSNGMKLNFANISNGGYDIMEFHEEISSPTGDLSEEGTTLLLTESADVLIDILTTSFITAAFVVLDDDDGNNTYSIIYFHDDEPLASSELNDDIFILRGPESIADEFETPLQLHELHKEKITLNENNIDVLNMPMEASNGSDNISEFGYWQVSPDITDSTSTSITYSIPLNDKNGVPFGVVGIKVDEDYFYKVLPDGDITEDGSLSYILAKKNKNSDEIIPAITNSEIQDDFAKEGIPLDLEMVNEKPNIYSIVNTNCEYAVMCSIYNLSLYDKGSPFENDQWLLIGLVRDKALYSFVTSFTKTFQIAFVSSIILGVILVFYAGRKFAKPIITLAQDVKTNDFKTIVTLNRTGYSEIDELSMAIEWFNQKILDEVLKTDKIIQMVDLPLGTFEYHKDDDFVTCSTMLLKLIDMPQVNTLSTTVDSKIFFEKINEIKQNVEDEQEHVYLIASNTSKWIKIVSIEQENTILGVVMDVTKETLNNHVIKFERDYDSLTKLFNRFAFRRQLEEIFRQGVKGKAALVLFDLDNLKYVNDTYGHDMGDIYIKSAGEVLSDKLRENCILGRMSGDEFYAFLHGFESKEAILDILKTIYASFDFCYLTLLNGESLKIRASGGMAWYGEDSTNLEELIRFADFAMYQGKHTLKGGICEFNKAAYENESFMLIGREELNKILDNKLIDYAFQPIITAKTGEIYGYEALMRPQSQILNSPVKLIQIATAQSQLWQIERITFSKSLEAYQKHGLFESGYKLFINSVPNEILSVAECLAIEEMYPDILKNLVIEVIENEKLDAKTLEIKRSVVKKWKALIALDDYGSGYNGDVSLLSLMPDIVKIDRMMITNIEIDRNRQSIVQKLLIYAKEQNIMVLAEGVETYSQMEYLVRIGVDYLQGYYIAKPSLIPDFNCEAVSREIQNIHRRNIDKK